MFLNTDLHSVSSEIRVFVFRFMSFINHQNVISKFLYIHSWTRDCLIRCNQNSSFLSEFLHYCFLFTFHKNSNRDAWTPHFKFILPVVFQRCWTYDDSFHNFTWVKETFQVNRNLSSFSKPHIICQNASFSMHKKIVQPCNSLLLVRISKDQKELTVDQKEI